MCAYEKESLVSLMSRKLLLMSGLLRICDVDESLSAIWLLLSLERDQFSSSEFCCNAFCIYILVPYLSIVLHFLRQHIFIFLQIIFSGTELLAEFAGVVYVRRERGPVKGCLFRFQVRRVDVV